MPLVVNYLPIKTLKKKESYRACIFNEEKVLLKDIKYNIPNEFIDGNESQIQTESSLFLDFFLMGKKGNLSPKDRLNVVESEVMKKKRRSEAVFAT